MAEQYYVALSSTVFSRVRIVEVWSVLERVFSPPRLPSWSVECRHVPPGRGRALWPTKHSVQRSHWTVAPLGHAGQAAGAKPGLYPLSKTGGGDRKSGRGRRRKVEQLQDGDSHAATARKHARGGHPFVATRVVLLYGIETGAAVIASNRIQPAVHGNQVMSAPKDQENKVIFRMAPCFVDLPCC